MRIAIAIMMFLVLASIGLGMLRSLGGGRPHGGVAAGGADPLPVAPPPDVRITFWCENCGTEVLLLRRGSESPPRHCGESMIRREEVSHN
ncbi:MAG TPA: hypothetical protein VM600_09820 [Actinomycetota bacterium]|nr:hypothetical protein [Actinomycetota bacterium]